MLVNPSGAARKSDPYLVQQIKTWVAEALHLEDDVSVMVTEVRCTTPDCPPMQTVMALLQASHPTRHYKIHKPLADITVDDVAALATVQSKLVSSTPGEE